MRLEDVTIGHLRSALRIYHDVARGKAPPQFPGADADPVSNVLASFMDEQKRVRMPAASEGSETVENVGPRRHALRLGCSVYPFTKFMIEEDSYLQGEFFFSVDTHEEALQQFATDEEGLGEIFEKNCAIKAEVESRWYQAGLPTQHQLLDLLESRLDRSSPARSIALLVVDDNVLGARHLQLLLQSEGYEVDVAHDGLEAIDRIDPRRHRLVIMDVQMPRLDGIAATRKLKANAATEGIPVLLTTAGALDLRQEHRAQAFVAKPLPIKVLLGWIDHLLAGK